MTDEERFAAVYEQYGPSLYRFCLLQMKNTADAEDILQDVFCKRLYHAPAFDSPAHERNWLFRVALNLCRDEWRHRRRADLPLEQATDTAVSDTLAGQPLLAAAACLPEAQRTVLHLHYYEGYDVREIARLLGVTTSAVKMRLKRGRDAKRMGGRRMNAYRLAMEQCTVPDGLQERLRNAVLKDHPQNAKPFRPRGFVRKTRLALLAAVLLLLLGAAAVWNSSFVRRFGPMAALSYMGGATFQEVNVTSVCDDVSLTVTQALCSEKSIFVHIVYTLPEEVRGQDYDTVYMGDLHYYGTGDITWEMLKEHDGEAWRQVDWGEFTSYIDVIQDPLEQKPLLSPYDMVWTRRPPNGQMMSGYGNSASVDREAGTVAWMQHIVLNTGWDFTSQPLTILVTPPCVVLRDGTSFPATDHPAIVTFQPAYDGPQSLTGTYEDDAVELRAALTPFSLSLYADGCGYEDEGELCRNTWLVTETGREIPAHLVGWTNSGGGGGYVATTVHTFAILDTREYTAVRIGNYIMPLAAPETEGTQ